MIYYIFEFIYVYYEYYNMSMYVHQIYTHIISLHIYMYYRHFYNNKLNKSTKIYVVWIPHLIH